MNDEPDFIEVDLRCSCGAVETRRLLGDARVRDVLERATCLFCGEQGCMKLSPPPREEERETPPHPGAP